MQDGPLAIFELGAHRLHEPSAGGRPVTRIYIDMAAPQTFRAMVRIAVAVDHPPAVSADEIFFRAFESPRHAIMVAQTWNAAGSLGLRRI